MASTSPPKHANCWTSRLKSASPISRRTVGYLPASQQDPATTRRFLAASQVRPHAEPGDLGSDQQWQDAAHETFLIAAPGHRDQQRDDRGASLLCAKP